MAIVEAAIAAGVGAIATIGVTKVSTKLSKKDCSDCSLTGTVATLKEASMLLVKYNDRIPEDEKDSIMKGLVR